MKRITTIALSICLLIALTSSTTPIEEKETKNESLEEELAISFTENLEAGNNLARFMDENWTLVYHEDNRCTGSTDGQKEDLSNTQVDRKIKINVLNKSEYAWACEEKEPYNFDYAFNLKQQIKDWDRFELQNDEYSDSSEEEKDVFYILGAGESDYIKIYIGENNLIVKLKYCSEDPG